MGPEANAAATQKPAEEAAPSIIQDANQDPNILADAEAQKTAQEAEDKRILEADVTTLSEEDKGKRATLETAKENKRLLDTPDDKLSEEDKPKKAELIKTNKAAEEGNKVPEKYEFKMPEGVTLDQAMVDKITPVLKGMKANQADAQKLIDFHLEQINNAQTVKDDAFKKYVKDSYDETIKALGSDYKKQLAFVAKVRDKFLSKETQELLESSGLSNVKPFVLDLIKIGQLVSEDTVVEGTPGGGDNKSPAQKMYPEQGK